MQWKIPQNENVGALHDTRLQSVWYFVVVLQFVEFLDHEAVKQAFNNFQKPTLTFKTRLSAEKVLIIKMIFLMIILIAHFTSKFFPWLEATRK